jgi:hypothetical protein
LAEAEAKQEKTQGRIENFVSEIMKEVVRDGNYITYDNGVVHDTKTGIEWLVGPDKDTTWDEAKEWVAGLEVAGGGWRMPSRKELKTLYKEGAGARNMTPLLKTTGWFVWSSETEDSSSAWSVDFLLSYEGSLNRSDTHLSRVFAVRSRSR